MKERDERERENRGKRIVSNELSKIIPTYNIGCDEIMHSWLQTVACFPADA